MPHRISMIIPNQSGGVMDYVATMTAQLGGDARMLVFDPARDMGVDGDSVLLHYSGYGYGRYGAPLHLLAWVRRNRPRMKRFGVFFHETHAQSSSPLSSVFWVSPVQRFIATQLARHADFWISNIEVSTDWLQARAGAVPHLRLPIYSSVGELAELPPVRDQSLVVFGSEPLRTGTWREAGEPLFRWAAANGVALHDIGSAIRDPDVAAMLQANGVTLHGRLPVERIHALMQAATFGMLAYSPHCVAKSSVFGAYCAHGLVPLLLSGNTGTYDGLASGTNYLHGVPATDPAPADLTRIARAAFDWYQGHSVAASVAAIDALLRPEAASAERPARSGARA